MMTRALSRMRALERRRERKNKGPVEIWLGYDYAEPGTMVWHGPNGRTATEEELAVIAPDAQRIRITYDRE